MIDILCPSGTFKDLSLSRAIRWPFCLESVKFYMVFSDSLALGIH